MEEQGDLHSGEDKMEGSVGFQQISPVTRTQAPGSELHGGRGPLIAGWRYPAGVKGRGGLSLGERGFPCT